MFLDKMIMWELSRNGVLVKCVSSVMRMMMILNPLWTRDILIYGHMALLNPL